MRRPIRPLRPTEAAALLGIHVSTLNRHIKAGTAPPSIKRGKFRMFDPGELERWLQERAGRPGGEAA